MSLLRFAFAAPLAAVIALLAGCGTAPTYLSRPPAHDAAYTLTRSPALDAEMHTIVFLDDARRMRYVQNFGGGGAGVGVMFGPLGVAANIAGIKSTTKADVELLKGRLPLDPIAEFRAAATVAGFHLDPGQADAPAVAPYLQVVRVDDTRLALGAVLVVDLGPSRGGWHGVYEQQLPRLIERKAVGQGLPESEAVALAAELREAFASVIAMARADANGELPTTGTEVTFQSAYVSPRFEWELPALRLVVHDGRTVLRTYGGVVSLPNALVKVKEPKPAKPRKNAAP